MASRKLQVEIERTLKKVNEGLELFHETLEKMDMANSASQKEKIEVELKKEIKKLQRLRDLIKGWQTLSELKDKTAINEARKSIEMEMERFKILEKEMKIKAYSKEGLSQAAKLDPLEQEKSKVFGWVNATVDKLGTQKDALEAELESLQVQMRKSKRLDSLSKHQRLEELPQIVERHKMHIRQLELLLRFMGNDRINPDEVNSIREDVEYYVESFDEANFVPDDHLYDHFDLPDDSDESEHESNSDSESSADSDPKSSRQTSSETSSSTSNTISANPLAGPTAISGSLNLKKQNSTFDSRKSTGVLLVNSSKTVASCTLDNKKVADLPTLASTKSSSTVTSGPPIPLPTVVVPKISGPSFASAIASFSISGAVESAALSTNSNNHTSNILSTHQMNISTSAPTTPKKPFFGNISSLPKAEFEDGKGPYEELRLASRRLCTAREITNGSKKFNFEGMKPALEASLLNCPDSSELERSRMFTPRQPFSVPEYYPTTPPPILENPAVFERFDLDTLFFIFYYQQRTYAQYLSARELKRQSWRFHKKYLTWFQRHEEPKIITDEYEQGTYIYFDYEGNWCQRKKSEFTFEYRFLEDEEHV